MNGARPRLADHRQRLATIAREVRDLRSALAGRDRLTAGFAHALRAVAAASLGYWGALALGLHQGFWAAIVAISVSQSNYTEVEHSSRDQFVGAIIGGLVGLAAGTLGHEHYYAYVVAVVVGMLICWLLHLAAAGRVSAITSTIILLAPYGNEFWQFALLRLAEVTLGAVAALVVTFAFDFVERRWFGAAPPPHRQ